MQENELSGSFCSWHFFQPRPFSCISSNSTLYMHSIGFFLHQYIHKFLHKLYRILTSQKILSILFCIPFILQVSPSFQATLSNLSFSQTISRLGRKLTSGCSFHSGLLSFPGHSLVPWCGLFVLCSRYQRKRVQKQRIALCQRWAPFWRRTSSEVLLGHRSWCLQKIKPHFISVSGILSETE